MLDFKVIKAKYRALPQTFKLIMAICLVALVISSGVIHVMKTLKPKETQCIESSQEFPASGIPSKLLGNIEEEQLKNNIMGYSHPEQPTISHNTSQSCGYDLIGWSNNGSSQRNTFQSQTNRISPAQAEIVTDIWEAYKDNTYLTTMSVRFDYIADNPKMGQEEEYQTSIVIKLNTQDSESTQSTIQHIQSIVSKIEDNSQDSLSTHLAFVDGKGESLKA